MLNNHTVQELLKLPQAEREEYVRELAEDLVEQALCLGVVLAIKQTSPAPYAMGNLQAKVETWAARSHLSGMPARWMRPTVNQVQDCYNAVIDFTLRTSDGLTMLRLWNEGEFDAIRTNWPEAPAAMFTTAEVKLSPKPADLGRHLTQWGG